MECRGPNSLHWDVANQIWAVDAFDVVERRPRAILPCEQVRINVLDCPQFWPNLLPLEALFGLRRDRVVKKRIVGGLTIPANQCPRRLQVR